MGLLSGKTALVFGVSNDHSIAWGIAQAFAREGARLGFSYAVPMERWARPLAESLGSTFIEPCDVTRDDEIAAVMEKAEAQLGAVDAIVHSVAFARREELSDAPYYLTSRDGFHVAMDVSVYSFTAIARLALPVMRPGGALLTMTYLGSERVVPHYNVMGLAKAALEASVRYLAYDLGRDEKRLRVNAISAGPIRTLAARGGITGFARMHAEFKGIAPLQRNVTTEDIGNAAVYLCSDLAAGVTGEVHFVDAGFNIVGVTESEPG
ncbi:MAG TPA: enoyl-ACP reductase [Chloroflexota bacterium]|nr:enoyl-ACP reductase [Chloroflexota bacterium]